MKEGGTFPGVTHTHTYTFETLPPTPPHTHTDTNRPRATDTYKNTETHVQAHIPTQTPHRLAVMIGQTQAQFLLIRDKAASALLLPQTQPSLAPLL